MLIQCANRTTSARHKQQTLGNENKVFCTQNMRCVQKQSRGWSHGLSSHGATVHMGPLIGTAWLLLSLHVVWTSGLQEDKISTGRLPARHTTWIKIHTTDMWKSDTVETFKRGKLKYTIQMSPHPKKNRRPTSVELRISPALRAIYRPLV